MAAGSILRQWIRRAGAFVALAFFSTAADAALRATSRTVTAVTDAAVLSCAQGLVGMSFASSSLAAASLFSCSDPSRSPDPTNNPQRRWSSSQFNNCPANLTVGQTCNVQILGTADGFAGAGFGQVTLFLTEEGTACRSGETYQGGACVRQCPAPGTLRWRGKLAGFRGQSVGCHNGCLVNRTQGAQPRFVVTERILDMTIYVEGRTGTEWLATGETCAIDSPTLSETSATLTSGTNYVTLMTAGDNCGVFNGESICLGAGPPDGACLTTASGQAFCAQSAASPPVPARAGTGRNGIPAQPADPVGTISITNDAGLTTVYNYYNAQASQQPATGTTTGGAAGTGGTTSGSTGGGTGGFCGLPGQALCGVNVDETGVPTSAPEGVFPDGTAEAQAKAEATSANIAQGEGAAADQTAATSGLWSILEGMVGSSSGECATVPYGFTAPPPFNVSVRGNFPEENGCQLFGVLRVIFSYALAGLTLLSCFRRVRQAFFSAPV